MSDQTDLPLFNFRNNLPSQEQSDSTDRQQSDSADKQQSDSADQQRSSSANDPSVGSNPTSETSETTPSASKSQTNLQSQLDLKLRARDPENSGASLGSSLATAPTIPKKTRTRSPKKLASLETSAAALLEKQNAKTETTETPTKAFEDLPPKTSPPKSFAEAIKIAKPADIVVSTPKQSEIEVPEEPAEPVVLSIEELNITIKKMLEGELNLIWARGEISNFKAHSSGHFYFSLKDAKSQISAVMFRGYSSKLRFRPADGVEVIVRGRISVYEPRGSYQILCEMMEPVGAGALQRAFELLKEKLKSEGLFETARKKQIPAHPRHVAIVTSPTGAAIRDIINILTRRAPWLPITIIPTIVQGDGCSAKICEAFEKAQRIPEVDVIIVGRGGGSIEDLWGFNDERLARLIAASPIPVISAVGHEIDFTIADFVSDLRAPTPSAAAELVAKSSTELTSRLQQLEKLLKLNTAKRFQSAEQKVRILTKGLIDPQKKLQDLALRNDDLLTRMQMAKDRALSERRYKLQILHERMGTPMKVIQERLKGLEYHRQCITKSLNHYLDMKRSELFRWTSMLDTLSPLKVVERGYSVVRKNEQVVTSAAQVAASELVQITLAHGQIEARVETVTNANTELTENKNDNESKAP